MTRPLIASGLMGVVIYVMKMPIGIIIEITNGGIVLRGITTMLIIAVGGFVYLYSIILFQGIKKNDIDSISPRIFRMLPRFLRVKLK